MSFDHDQSLMEFKAARSGPKIEAGDPRIAQMISALRGEGWMKRHVLRARLGWNDRVMRAVKAASGGRIISTSELGYCLAAEASREDFAIALGQMRSRIKQQGRFYIDMLREFHRVERRAA
jgi:hypothetical protein